MTKPRSRKSAATPSIHSSPVRADSQEQGASEELGQALAQRWKPLLEKLHDIPTLPLVATKVTDLINDPNSSSSDIAAVLKKDQVLTAKVIKLVNSPYYGIPGGVTDVQRALAYLGFNTLAQLVLSVSIITLFSQQKDSKFSMHEFWRHALATAVASEIIAKHVNYPKPEECFTCGLLHDIGKIVLYQLSPEDFKRLVAISEKQHCSFVEAEKKLDLPPHGYLGEYIAVKWRLPLVIRLSIRYHHTDVSQMETIMPSMKPAIQIVTLANQLVNYAKIGYSGNASGGSISAEYTDPLRIAPEAIAAMLEQIKKNADSVGAFLRQAA